MGELFSVLCAFTWALAVVFMRDASREVNALAFSTYKMALALILLLPTIWIAGIKYASASIAAVLNQTSTVFIIFFAVVFLKEKLSVGKIIGGILGVVGTFIVIWN